MRRCCWLLFHFYFFFFFFSIYANKCAVRCYFYYYFFFNMPSRVRGGGEINRFEFFKKAIIAMLDGTEGPNRMAITREKNEIRDFFCRIR